MFRKRRPKVTTESIELPEQPEFRNPGIGSTRGTFFSRKTHDCGALINQPNINVTVNIDQGESDIISCLKACFGCIGSAAGGATGA